MLATGDSAVPQVVREILKFCYDNTTFYVVALYENCTPKHLSLLAPHNRELIDDVINQIEEDTYVVEVLIRVGD